jgi:UDP-N-acetylglucosamine 2-epimerase (non-hydrolysing)
MKIAPLYHALKKESWAEPVIVHTGQHYDLNMSDVFFADLGLPAPDIHLGVGSGSHAEQTGHVMIAYEEILMETRPDMVIVVGDVNSTMACTIAATKIDYRSGTSETSDGHELSAMSYELNGRRPCVGHLEAGLRSRDRTMPEEINRLVTDSLADILWTPSPDGDENLVKEGVAADKIDRVGNIMIDSLEMLRPTIEKEDSCSELNLQPDNYGLLTLHRPSNVDDPKILADICKKLIRISQKIPLVFPVHPRTRKNMEKQNLMSSLEKAKQMMILEPLNYIRFMNLVFNCRFALTDSGGIQEETSYLGIPCLTLRPNTERPITVTAGTNRLCTVESFEKDVEKVLSEPVKSKTEIDLWDGQTADRVVESIKKYFKL